MHPLRFPSNAHSPAEDGFARPILLVNGETPGSTIKATQGEAFAVTVNNMLAVQIGMHW
jgi:FtsP/CotA-like multicopper oxidase with cupredoxin domain